MWRFMHKVSSISTTVNFDQILNKRISSYEIKNAFFLLITCCLLGFSTSPFFGQTKTSSSPEDKLSQALLRFNRELEIIKNEYVQKISEHELLQNAMQGMASGLEPYSSFLNSDDLKDLQTATTG